MLDTFPLITDVTGLRYVISTRDGGVSAGDFSSLNLGYHVADDSACVTENRRRLAVRAGYDAATLVCGQQVHGAGIVRVNTGERGRGAFSWPDALPDTDGLLVSESNLPVAILVADCAPLLIVDPVHHLLAVVHAGWRGALARIASQAIHHMHDAAGTDPAACRVGIGPTLCAACLEVSGEVGCAVEKELGPGTVHHGSHRPHLDIRAMLCTDLTAAGVTPARIIAHPACPRCEHTRFFSYRAQHGRTGRFALVAWWK
ncbi:MAG: polyphenol oxidase family protein [Armatimonadota bacterium]